MKKPILISCYGFKIKDGIIKIPIEDRKYFVGLNNHTKQVLSDLTMKVNSFTLTPNTISLTISKEVLELKSIMTA